MDDDLLRELEEEYPEVDDPEYVPLPTQEGQVVVTMIQKKNTPET